MVETLKSSAVFLFFQASIIWISMFLATLTAEVSVWFLHQITHHWFKGTFSPENGSFNVIVTECFGGHPCGAGCFFRDLPENVFAMLFISLPFLFLYFVVFYSLKKMNWNVFYLILIGPFLSFLGAFLFILISVSIDNYIHGDSGISSLDRFKHILEYAYYSIMAQGFLFVLFHAFLLKLWNIWYKKLTIPAVSG